MHYADHRSALLAAAMKLVLQGLAEKEKGRHTLFEEHLVQDCAFQWWEVQGMQQTFCWGWLVTLSVVPHVPGSAALCAPVEQP